MSEERDIDQLIDALASDLTGTPEGSVMFVTGAGLSLASGIPTFRGTDPGAVWANDILEKGTLAYFQRKPADSWAWYKGRFGSLAGYEPNAGHRAITGMQKALGEAAITCSVVTQNVDGLHIKAGAGNVFEVHGAARKVRCSAQKCANGGRKGSLDWTEELVADEVPRCPLCRKPLRPHVLWFDESYEGHEDYRYRDLCDVTFSWTCLVFVGTSHAVGITELLYEAAMNDGIPVYNVNPTSSRLKYVTEIPGKAEDVLPVLEKRVRWYLGDAQ